MDRQREGRVSLTSTSIVNHDSRSHPANSGDGGGARRRGGITHRCRASVRSLGIHRAVVQFITTRTYGPERALSIAVRLFSVRL